MSRRPAEPSSADAHRWQRVKALFAGALDQPADQRDAYLRDGSQGDASLRAEVSELLAHHDASQGALATAALFPSRFAALEELPLRVGNYKILGVLGRGGMGVVYRAEQESPRRTVALKVIQPLSRTLAAVRRFEHEAALLARLSHPGIAQIFEAGSEERGGLSLPFFAMELVVGVPLRDWVVRERPSLHARLELFARVCDAVQHAHQKGVIHRDLKSSNILVDAAGQPKVLDFGVARATQDVPGEDGATIPITGAGQLVGTLQTMSPEQVAGDPQDLDTRSDVYSLGVVLYELLAERAPYDLANRSMPEVVKLIETTDPARLGSIDRTLAGDLETIAAKALEKDRARRYASASDLAEDVRRHLRDEPIAARPASTVYQAAKFARRHRALVAGLAATFAALVLGIAGTGWQAVRAEEAGTEAQREASSAVAVLELLVDILASADPGRAGSDVKVVDQLEQGLLRLDAGFTGAPAVEAAVRAAIARTYLALGDHARAAEQAERAAAIFARELGAAHAETLEAQTVRGLALSMAGDYAAADALLAEVEDAYRATLGDRAPETAFASARHATVLYHRGEHDRAAEKLERALEVAREFPERAGTELRTILNGLAVTCTLRGDHARAVELWEESISLVRAAHPGPHPDLAQLLYNQACGYGRQGRPELALPRLREAARIQREVYSDGHPALATTLQVLAGHLFEAGELEEAESLIEEACRLNRKFLPPDNPYLAASLYTFGALLMERGDFAAAEVNLREAVAIRKAREREAPVEHFDAAYLLALSLGEQEKHAEAGDLFLELLPSLDRVFPAGDLRVADVELAKADIRFNAGCSLRSSGREAEAEPLLVQAFEAYAAKHGERDEQALDAVRELVAACEALGKLDAAEAWRARL